MNIKARKGVIIATGGCAGNPVFRTMFDVRLTEEYQAENSEWTQRTGDGEIAAMQIGAALGATACQTTQDDNLITKGRMGKKSNGTLSEPYPTSRHFFRARALGLVVKDYQNVILVKENGVRFYDETVPTRDYEYYAAALAWTGDPKKFNGGGPIWAVFDADAVAKNGTSSRPMSIPTDSSSAPTRSRNWPAKSSTSTSGGRCRKRPCGNRDRYNSFVDPAEIPTSRSPTAVQIQTPPFYAAWQTPVTHDTPLRGSG